MTAYRPAEGLGVVETDDATYVAWLPDGPIMVLDGLSSAIWLAACAGPAATVAERVADGSGLPLEEIRGTVDKFLVELVERGLLVAAPETYSG